MTGRYIRYKYKSCFIKNVLFGRDRHRWTQTEYFTGPGLARLGQVAWWAPLLSSERWRPGGSERFRTARLHCTALLTSWRAGHHAVEFNQRRKNCSVEKIKIQVAGWDEIIFLSIYNPLSVIKLISIVRNSSAEQVTKDSDARYFLQ